MTLRLGTRRSSLAMTQAQLVADLLAERAGLRSELVGITTAGDRTQSSGQRLSDTGGTGVFTSALRESLRSGDIELAVHSLKDLPTAPVPGIQLAAVPLREDPRDALVARDGLKLADLPEGARVGTGSLRRAAQLRSLRRDLAVVPIRGNVDTRIGKVLSGEVDAVVLARAGLARLGRLDAVTETLDPRQAIPAPGQGALAVECRADDTETIAGVAQLDDPATRASVIAERTVLAVLEAGCSAPVGAYAEPLETTGATGESEAGEAEISLCAAVVAVDGTASVQLSIAGPAERAEDLGRQLATEMLARGVAALIGERVR